MGNKKSIIIQGTEIQLIKNNDKDFISLTDITRQLGDGEQLIKNWLQSKATIEYLGVWEQLNNPSFNIAAYYDIYEEAGLNRFVISVSKWIDATNATGIIASAGRYGGTHARPEIAMEFASWLNPALKVHIINKLLNSTKEPFDALLDGLFSFNNLPSNLPTFAYLMKDGLTEFYKIGVSRSPTYREKTLQAQQPSVSLLLTKLFANRSECYAFESGLHKRYSNYRVRGEWFNFTPVALQEVIQIFEQ